jgi:putative ABC transport system permease protein
LCSVIESLLRRSLPLPDPNRLVMLWKSERINTEPDEVAPTNFFDWQKNSRSFVALGAAHPESANLTDAGDAVRVECLRVTGGLLPALGISPQIGRLFRAEEDWPQRSRVALISYDLWQGRFGGDSNVLGRTITLDGRKHRIIGVMPRGFRFLSPLISCWTPIGLDPNARWQEGRYLRVLARLKPGVSVAAAQADLHALTQRMAQENPQMEKGWGVVVQPIREQYVGKGRLPVLALACALAIILLIACANVGGLLLARGAARARETAIRVSLGATRWRITSQNLTEALLLTGAGGLLGLILAWTGTDSIVRAIPKTLDISSLGPVAFDGRVLLFAMILIVSTGFICGVAPALAAARQEPQAILRGGSLSHSRVAWVRRSFVIAQTALAFALLSGAGLLIRSVYNLYAAPIGFQPENVLTFDLSLPDAKYPNDSARRAFFREALDRLGRLPGVSSAAVVNDIPLGGLGVGTAFYITGRPDPPPGDQPIAQLRAISPSYFATLGIPLRAGRDFTIEDGASVPRAYIINEMLARRYFPHENPVGRQISILWASREPGLVIGVVGDVRYTGINNDVLPTVYWSQFQHMFSGTSFVLKTAVPPMGIANSAARAIRALDPELPISQVRPMVAVRDRETVSSRLLALLLGALAALAVVLASSGLFGLLAYLVTLRTREIGIRLALGAPRGRIVASTFREGLFLIVLGLLLGTAFALAGTRFLRNLLYGVAPWDLVGFGVASLVLAIIAGLAILLPASRAARVDPSKALRLE